MTVASDSGSERERQPPVSPVLLLLYNVMYLVGFLFYAPLFVWKLLVDRAYRGGIRERMGIVPPRAGNVVWVHGVSVGEVKAAAPIIDGLHVALPGIEIVVSATTPTGAKVARDLYGAERVLYYPFDFWYFPARALDRVRPRCVLLMELELWPNFLNAAERRGVAVAVVNGRISERSWRGYRRVSWLLPQLDRIDLFSVQNDVYAWRLKDLGVSTEKIHSVGNVKYDRLATSVRDADGSSEFRRMLALDEHEPVIVAGSTHHDEEARLARVGCALEHRLGRSVRLVIVPRHPERCGSVVESVERALRDAGLSDRHSVIRLTEVRAKEAATVPARKPWLVIDTIGELEQAYAIADAAFVGGSLVPHGGQNLLEPIAIGTPTLIGPHVWNFGADVELFLAARGVIQVADEQHLERELARLVEDPGEAEQLVFRAQRVLRENRGATERTLDRVLALLRERCPDLFPLPGNNQRHRSA